MLLLKEDTDVLLVDLSWMWFTYLKLMCIRESAYVREKRLCEEEEEEQEEGEEEEE